MAKVVKNDELYVELVSRIDHIDRAFIVRRHIKLHYAKTMPDESTKQYIKVRVKYSEFFSAAEEALLWFITVELWSRFTANSSKGLRSLIYSIGNEDLKNAYTQFKKSNSSVISYIDTQRLKYFAHADSVSWEDFPNIHDKEYERIINDLKLLLGKVGAVLNNQRVPGKASLAAKHTDLLYDDLLRQAEPGGEVDSASTKFQEGLEAFLNSDD